MSNALLTAVNGLTNSVARATQAAGNIANASLTGKNLDENLVKIRTEQTNVAANAAVIKTEHKNQQSLLDILA